MLSRFAFGLHFVCEMCARPEGFVREFRRAMASLAAIFPTDHLLSGPPLFGTLSAHRPGHDIAKHAIRRHGLADAGSVDLRRHCARLPVVEVGLQDSGPCGVSGDRSYLLGFLRR